MNKYFSSLGRIVYLTSIGFALILFFLLARHWNDSDNAELPAWLQAWGGIAGIAVAVWISREDIRRTTRAKLEDEEILDSSVRRILDSAVDLVTQVEEGTIRNELSLCCDQQYLEPIYKAFVERNSREIHAVLVSFSIERLASIGLIDSVIQTRRAMIEIAEQSKWFNFDNYGQLAPKTKQQFDVAKKMVLSAYRDMPKRTKSR
ncbi:hypothetical protein [Pseudoduganella lutea]|uniref:DUF4760 domain-containing protein n=1 Tax=Pseudoduganella lutea TaxID=321985 RepID=A0A4P6L3X3_9BURK|nr:hypothetical protein [Pseudoduganella lutea]QBE65995.1 hypothetical protein EWM63_25900 [Pseudoduganella lutea]